MFLSILVAFYDTVSLHQAGQIFIICIFLSAIIQNVNLAGPQQEQEPAPRQGQRQATEWTSASTRSSSRTMPRALMIVKDIPKTSRGVHTARRPSHPATFTHSYQRICAAKIYSIVFAPPHSRRLIHVVLLRQHSRHTYAAALTPHLCSSIDAAALKLPRPHSTYSAALTPPHLCCSSHAAALVPQL